MQCATLPPGRDLRYLVYSGAALFDVTGAAQKTTAVLRVTAANLGEDATARGRPHQLMNVVTGGALHPITTLPGQHRLFDGLTGKTGARPSRGWNRRIVYRNYRLGIANLVSVRIFESPISCGEGGGVIE